MCGIFAYLGNRSAKQSVITGLKNLDYRGYDSWGIGVLDSDNKISITKSVGQIVPDKGFDILPESTIGIGHTRWATHGGVTKVNAHPHFSTNKDFIIVHNGIVDNFNELKSELKHSGYIFKSETDTEVIVRLIEHELRSHTNLDQAIRQSWSKLKGRNTICVLHKDGTISGVRNGSPLLIGISEKSNEIYLSSDTLSFSGKVEKICMLDNNQMVIIKDGLIKVVNLITNTSIKPQYESATYSHKVNHKQGFDHYMLKEIFDTPQAITAVVKQNQDLLLKITKVLSSSRSIYTIGSGTAGAAASQLAYFLHIHAGIRAVSLIGAESESYINLMSDQDVIIALSQSGETADVIEVLQQAKDKGVKIVSYVNMQASMITRLSDYPFMANAGGEVSVMSTKIFSSQIAFGYLLAMTMAGHFDQAIDGLRQTSLSIQEYLNQPSNLKSIHKLAKLLVKHQHILLMAKSQNLAIAKEGMIKIIEASYIHAHALSAGDLKHYAITLIKPGFPVIALVAKDSHTQDLLNAIHEVKARGAKVFAISPYNNPAFDYYLPIPHSPNLTCLHSTIALQLLAYYMALELGNNIDKPRNIAKSVTVK